ncbi:MAG TPA: hypothetical protein VJZ26_18885 [Blastocatellia bacterium]|nr:hypothetical protein [Blastocatellia bacterium]
MKSRFSLTKIAALVSLSVTILAVSCVPVANNTNSSNANNSNSSASAAPGGRPADAVPAPDVPGSYMAGPTGNVSLRFTAPNDGQSLDGSSVAPTFAITGYPIYKDAERNKGQHIHVILDNEPYEADYDPNKPFSPDSGKFNNLSPGTHTLRAFPSREWHESIKQPDGADFDMVVFNAGGGASAANVNKRAPLLTYSRPKGEYKPGDDPRGVMLDFYVTNATLGENDYKVRYTLDGKNPKVVTRWEPVWWKWEDVQPGEHTVLLELLDKDNKPVPFEVGTLDYNRTERKFTVLADGQQPAASDHHGNSNAPATANRNSGAGNRNTGSRNQNAGAR